MFFSLQDHGHSHGGHGHSHGGHGHLHEAHDPSHGHSHGEGSKLNDERGRDSQHKEIVNGHGISAAESEKLVVNHGFHGTSNTTADDGADKNVFTMHNDQTLTDITIDLEKPKLGEVFFFVFILQLT